MPVNESVRNFFNDEIEKCENIAYEIEKPKRKLKWETAHQNPINNRQ